jgi:hypothetical protein
LSTAHISFFYFDDSNLIKFKSLSWPLGLFVSPTFFWICVVLFFTSQPFLFQPCDLIALILFFFYQI